VTLLRAIPIQVFAELIRGLSLRPRLADAIIPTIYYSQGKLFRVCRVLLVMKVVTNVVMRVPESSETLLSVPHYE